MNSNMEQKLSQYISDLLHLHNYVIIPNFGGFVTNYLSAELESNQNFIHPPSKEILFNIHLTHDDGLLLQHICTKELISFDVAKIELELLIKDFKRRLLKGEFITFESIGSFYYNTDKSLVFEPLYTTNYLAESFGLPNLFVSPLHSDYSLDKFEIQHNMSPSVNFKNNFIKAAAIGIPIVAIMGFLSLKTNVFRNTHSEAALNPIEAIFEDKTDTIHKDTIKTDTNLHQKLKTMTKPNQALFYSEESAQEKTIYTVQKNNYYLIAGSFKNHDNANSLLEQLSKQGYSSEILEGNNGWFRVSYKQFDEKLPAMQELTAMRKAEETKTVWLYTKKRAN